MLSAYRYHFLLILAVLFWSGNFVVGKYISSEISPIELNFYRWFFVLIVISPYYFMNFKKINGYIKKYFFKLILFGFLAIAVFNSMVYTGFQTTTATNALLINSSIPIIIVILSSLILKKHLNKIEIAGILISTIGVSYVILKGDFAEILNLSITEGDIWILVACIDWALYSVLLKYKPEEIKGFDFLLLIIMFGVVFQGMLFFLTGHSFSSVVYENEKVLYSLFYIVLFPSILSYYFWNVGITEVGANKGGQYSNLMPISGSILTYFFLGEQLYYYHFIGLLMVFIGIYLTQVYKSKNA